jgi:nitrite reductase/ring-hydroxylating ferredoxin subunit
MAENDFITVARLSELPPGTVACVEAAGMPVSLANTDGSIHAFSPYCTHAMGLLGAGELEGTIVRCPLHGSTFDVVTGRVVGPPADEDIETIEVRVEGDEIRLSEHAIASLQ